MRAFMSFLESFMKVVAEHGNKTAILLEGQPAFTYRELATRAWTLGTALHNLGAGPESVVGLCLEKSPEYVSSMLGVWFSRAAFVPLDPSMPQERLAHMIIESGMSIVITQPENASLFNNSKLHVITPNTEDLDDSRQSILSLALPKTKSQDLAYIIYTSGSTGQPKGVMITHSGIVNFLEAQITAFSLSSTSRTLFYLSTNFDASISDIGTALLSGATLCIESPDSLLPGKLFSRLLTARGITHMDIPPSLLQILNPDQMPECLQTIIIGGEACSTQVVRRWAKRFRVVNVYGPTEATVCSSLCKCSADTWEHPLIGNPLPGVCYYIVDEQLDLTPQGAAGELLIGGVGLARGYLNQPELTMRKFITWNGQRLYRTGDLVVEREGGDIQFLGRIDRQVKLHGHLIAPEEIEAKLLEHESVSQAVVLPRQLNIQSKRDSLVAFVVLEKQNKNGGRALTEHLSTLLPRWMIPAHYEFVDSIPLTVTGKPDLKLLQRQRLSRESTAELAQQSVNFLEQTLINVWKQVLGLDHVGIYDDFFQLGGDSFAVLEVIVAAEANGLTISPTILMTKPTIAEIVGSFKEQEGKGVSGLHADMMSCTDLREDVKLSEKWQGLLDQAHGRSTEIPKEPQHIFLTGATGFLGSRLLQELLARTKADVYCLVRAQDSSSALTRILNAVKLHGYFLTSADLSRIHTVLGTLADKHFGISSSDWDKLARTIDTVYHCAAHVNVLLPYAQLRPPNIEGTHEIVRLLCDGQRKHLHYASTLSVFVGTDCNFGVALESDKLDRTNYVYGGYAQSKWAAEVLLRSLGDRAGPISYYRFGLITGDSKKGVAAPTDFLTLFLRGILSLGCVPFVSPEISVDVTPVDFAAAAFAQLSLSSQLAQKQLTFHIANSRSLALCDLITYLRELGLTLEEIPASDFIDKVYQSGKNGLKIAESAACLALCRCLTKNSSFENFRTMDLFQATNIKFDMTNTYAWLSKSEISCPSPSKELIGIYLKQMLSSNSCRD